MRLSEITHPRTIQGTDVPRWTHQPALDGLRTVAVYLVVLFHAGFAWAKGGFVGVDVFFVLSGFLVTNTLLNEQQASGSVRLRRFYARRVRRLLPASLVLIIVACVLAAIVEPKYLALSFISDARAALLYVANWKFLSASTDYFAADVHHSPFLHFWSLAIEEQFYFVFPLVFIVGARLVGKFRKPRLLTQLVGVLFVGSILSQLVSAASNPVRAYYATDARVYQILAGALLALVTWEHRVEARNSTRKPLHLSSMVITGLLVLVGLATIDGGMSASARGLVATIAAVAVIAGLDALFRTGATDQAVIRAFGSRAPTYLGRISYGTYLWHWPLIVVARSAWDIDPWAALVIGGMGGTIMAAISQMIVEQPIRTNKKLGEHPRAVVGVGLAAGVVVAAVVVSPLLHIPRVVGEKKFSVASNAPEELKAALATTAPHDFDFELTKPPAESVTPCTVSAIGDCYRREGGKLRVTIIGDSNAEMLIPALYELAGTHDITLSALTRSGCPWQRGLMWGAHDQRLIDNCRIAHRDWYDTMLPALKPDVVMLVNVTRDPGSRPDAFYDPEDGETVASATAKTLDLLETIAPKIVILEPLPVPNFDPTQCLRTAKTVGDCAFAPNSTPFPTERIYRGEAERRPSVFAVDYDGIACPFVSACVPVIDGTVVFRDNYHLSNEWLMGHRDEFWSLIATTGAFR